MCQDGDFFNMLQSIACTKIERSARPASQRRLDRVDPGLDDTFIVEADYVVELIVDYTGASMPKSCQEPIDPCAGT